MSSSMIIKTTPPNSLCSRCLAPITCVLCFLASVFQGWQSWVPLSQGTAASQFDVPLLVLVLLDSLLPSSRLSLGIRREGHAGWQLDV